MDHIPKGTEKKGGRHLESIAHLATPLQDVLHHLLPPLPHGVALLHEELVESHLVPHVRVECGGLYSEHGQVFEGHRVQAAI